MKVTNRERQIRYAKCGFLPAILLLALVSSTAAQTAPDANSLTQLLKDFLEGASRNDPKVHDRFWAEDLIYTRSSGRRVGKSDVMRDVRSAPAPKPEDPTTRYSAEDVRIQQYGDTAIVAFSLVGTTEQSGRIEVANYLNTGTFLKRNGIWQAVSWQATRMPRPEEELKKDILATEAAFLQALFQANSKVIESLTVESFTWISSSGEVTRQALLDQLKSEQSKFQKAESSSAVSVYGDTGITKGALFIGRPSRGSPAVAYGFGRAPYTLVLANQGGGWKVITMHTSIFPRNQTNSTKSSEFKP